jgi:hypothetical protein
MKQEDKEAVLIAAVEAADELLLFLWNNAEENNGKSDHNIEINVSESHVSSFVALFNEAKQKLEAARLIL